jgi:hypothetical protein
MGDLGGSGHGLGWSESGLAMGGHLTWDFVFCKALMAALWRLPFVFDKTFENKTSILQAKTLALHIYYQRKRVNSTHTTECVHLFTNERRIKKSFFPLFPSGQSNSGILLLSLIESSESDYLALPPPCLKGSH